MSYPLHKRPKALARYYVTSYWQAEWVKKLKWKTIESPRRPLAGTYRSSHWIELHHGAFLPNFCLALVRRSSISAVLTVPKYATASCRSLGIIGKIPVFRRESSLWAGECSYPWWGVYRKSSRASWMSLFFWYILFTVFNAASALPFLCGHMGKR